MAKKSRYSHFDKNVVVKDKIDGHLRQTRVAAYHRKKRTLEPLDNYLKEVGWNE